MSPLPPIQLNDCGCCEGIRVETFLEISNRPGLSTVAYRIGTYASFRQSMLARLSDARWPVLRQLRTRDHDDFTIALLDAWAVAGDVLTFYQERIANESYLRTATERLSILEQARLLGYQLAPGLAAGTYLAFTLDTAPGAPEQAAKPVTIAIGARVQSVPGPDEQPQVFETIEAIEARPEWNAILPQLTEPQPLAWNMTELWLQGAALTLAVGDVVLIIAETAGIMRPSLRRVTAVRADATAGRTKVQLATISPEPTASLNAQKPGVFVMRTLAPPFGHNAPLEPKYDSTGKFLGKFSEWQLDHEVPHEIALNARYDKIISGSKVGIEHNDPGSTGSARLWTFSEVVHVIHRSMAKYGMAGSVTRLTLATPWSIGDGSDLALLRSMTIAAQNEELPVAALPLTYPVYGSELALDTRVEGLAAGRPLAISGKRQRIRITERLNSPELALDGGGKVTLQADDILAFAKRPAKIVDGKAAPLTPVEFHAALSEGPATVLWLHLIDRDGQGGSVFLHPAAFALEPAADDDDSVSEIAFIDDPPDTAVIQDRDRTTVRLAANLAYVYDRTTVRINANVAAATHGETVRELLGSGDATLPYQRFTLRQPPLTYVSADTPSGSASTLNVYVNDVLWQEVPFFFGRGPTDHVYVTRRDDEGRTTIRFGDGVTGARLPTGQNNVRAEYRKGTGLSGLVGRGQLSQLLTRPLGVREVINPQDAKGAEDPESRDEARTNAPTTVLTLDRAVSLRDYEDFARTFAGVAKAQAVWVWDGRKRSIFLTVAGPEGEMLTEDGTVIANLQAALRNYGDPFVPFTIKSYRKALFQIHGTVTVHPDHVIDTVMAAVTADLKQRYSFDTRMFGQPVALSDTIAAIQAIAGVLAVDVDAFYRNDAPAEPIQPRLRADRPAMGADGTVPAAELLLLDETSLEYLEAIQ
jgi:hypothetical protein